MKEEKRLLICSRCGNKIEISAKYVVLETIDKEKIKQKDLWHFQCWVNYINEAVTRQAKERLSFAQGKVLGILENPTIKSLISQVQGTDQVIQLLKTPLQNDKKTDLVDMVKEKLRKKKDHARKKRRKLKKN